MCQYRAVVSDAVKLHESPRRGRGKAALALAAVTLITALFASFPAFAQLLDLPRTVANPKPAALDARLPTGAERSFASRPTDVASPACSSRRPVCVHTTPGVAGELALRLLDTLERAYEKLVLVSGLPQPRSDRGLGGSSALDVYVEQAGTMVTEELRVQQDAPLLTAFDEAPGFCVLRLVKEASADELARWATLCIGELVLLRLDASETPHARRAVATHWWQMLGRPTAEDFRSFDDAQSKPERAYAKLQQDESSAGAALLFEYLEQRRSNAAPFVLSASLFALSAGKSDPTARRWNNEPDWLDVFRHSFREDRPTVAAALADFAVARAFLGTRDDGRHVPTLAWLGDFGRVRFDWVLTYSSLPRRVAATRPIEPTGSIYVWLELDELALGSVVGFQATWERPVAFKWSLVRVDKDGVELSRIDVPFQETASSVEARAADLEAAAALLIVGTNLGGVDLAHPFDPDRSPFEPHGCLVYLAKL
jgi:hypothetical protein